MERIALTQLTSPDGVMQSPGSTDVPFKSGPRQDHAVCRPVASSSGRGIVSSDGYGTAVTASTDHFMIAKIDTSACTSGPKPHAGVSILAIMDLTTATDRRGNVEPISQHTAPHQTTPDSHSRS
jgi:hypothetical protein